MASIVTFSLNTKFSINPKSSSSSQVTPIKLTSQFIRFGYLGSCRTTRKLGANSGSKTTLRSCRTTRKPGANSGSKITCWFRFGSNGVDAEGAGIYGSQSRDDFDRDDVEQYFNYMGMLAVEGTYDKMEALLNQNIHPVDILLLMAASEGDKPKIEELLRAGADYTVKDGEGRTALDRAASDEVKDLIQSFAAQRA